MIENHLFENCRKYRILSCRMHYFSWIDCYDPPIAHGRSPWGDGVQGQRWCEVGRMRKVLVDRPVLHCWHYEGVRWK